MFIPKQGFRHAVDLLLANTVRRMPLGVPSEAVSAAAIDMAEQLVALAADMKASRDCVEWVVAEYDRVLSVRLADLPGDARARGHALLATIGRRQPSADRRDLFMLYAPEDRLPVAAPLAIELSKRGVSVAFADGEVATAEELTDAIGRGLAEHERGVLLTTTHLARRIGTVMPAASDRLLHVSATETTAPAATAESVLAWRSRFAAAAATFDPRVD